MSRFLAEFVRKSRLKVGVLMLPGQVPLDLAGPIQVLHSAQRLGADITIRFFGPQRAINWLAPLVLSGIEPLPLAGWREADIDTPAEKAALAWTESPTNIEDTGACDADYEALKVHFVEKEIVDLTYLVGLISPF